jgi:hypothetical protein
MSDINPYIRAAIADLAKSIGAGDQHDCHSTGDSAHDRLPKIELIVI